MVSVTEFVDDFLAHYASEYYDPVKAREYYLRTRELKGRQPGKLKSDKQRNAWEYTKGKIDEAKKAELEKAAADRKLAVEMLREELRLKLKGISEKVSKIMEDLAGDQKEEVEGISQKLASDLEQLANNQKKERESILAEASRKMSSLPVIPKNATPEQRARITAERQAEIERIRGSAIAGIEASTRSAATQRGNLVNSAKKDQQRAVVKGQKERKDVMDEVVQGREELRAGLTAAIDKARVEFEARRESLKAKYEEVANREFDAIRRRV